MASNLVIVESPAKCAKIQGFLGFGWKVIASMGHIRHLKEELASVGIEKDFEPTWEWMKEKAQTIQRLRDDAKGAQTIYLASDDDREGELIAYSVCLLLKLNPKTAKRAVFHEITESAVKAAVAKPRLLDMNRVNAAQARAMLDMMIGFTMSPLLWKSIGPALSAGRCQTPALRLVVEREQQIKGFKSTSGWKLGGQWSAVKSKMIWDAHLVDELEDRDSAEALLELCHDKPGATVTEAVTRPWSQQSPQPLITSTLQQQASSLFRIPPKETMRAAQKLYEAGHITYMRTDKATLSEEATQQAQEFVKATYGEQYIGLPSNPIPQKKTSKKTKEVEPDIKTQDAHEAVRPTHMELRSLSPEEDWSPRERKLYELVWLRTIQSVMAPAKGDQRSVTFLADGEDSGDFPWRASWRKTTFDGWRKAATKETTDAEDQEQEQDATNLQWALAESLNPGSKLTWHTMTAEPHNTKAPPRYSEAALIKDLEQRGIGRPSTFASLVSTITDKEYVKSQNFEGREITVEKLTLTKPHMWPPQVTPNKQKVGAEKDRLAPTPLGISVLEYLLRHFDDLFQYGFTASMESRLDHIADGTEQWKKVLEDTWGAYKERYGTLMSAAAASSRKEGDRRRVFENGLIAILGKNGPLLLRESPDGDEKKTVFYGWPEGASFPQLTEEEATAFVAAQGKEKEGENLGDYHAFPIVRKKGKYGVYAEWNGKRVACQETDTFEAIAEKIEAARASGLRQVGVYEIRQGPYGPYMFKTTDVGPARKFVSVPASIDISTVSESDLTAIYQAGLEQKKSGGFSSRGRGRGGFRGRGAWRGRRGS
jgi:DNA topoisomerase-1